MSDGREKRERLLELLADRALGALSRDDAWELAHLVAADIDETGREFSTLDVVVGELDLDVAPASGAPLPEALRQRILADAPRHVAASSAPPSVVSGTAPAPFSAVSPRPSGSRTRFLPWAAAAAGLLAALWGWWPRLGEIGSPVDPASTTAEQMARVEATPPPTSTPAPEVPSAEPAPSTALPSPVPDPSPPATAPSEPAGRPSQPSAEPSEAEPARPAPAAPPSLEEKLAALEKAPDARRSAWERTEDVVSLLASGEVVWSESRQEGVMRFEGLPPNNPAAYQYQLWIFDAERDERYPVDGGVFDVAVHGEPTLVPIDAKLPVHRATLFAVTLEPPGGVVVSSRERILLLAKLP